MAGNGRRSLWIIWAKVAGALVHNLDEHEKETAGGLCAIFGKRWGALGQKMGNTLSEILKFSCPLFSEKVNVTNMVLSGPH